MITDLTAAERRAAYIQGLDALSTALKADPEMPLPMAGATSIYPLKWSFFSNDPVANREQMARAAGALDCQWREQIHTDSGHTWYYLIGELNGLHVKLTGERAEVCERVVTGQHTVEEVEWRGPLSTEGPVAA